MKTPVPLSLALTLFPAVASACPACLSSAYGDRTYNWAFLGLLLMPFLIFAVIGSVLAWVHVRRRADDRRSNISIEETT